MARSRTADGDYDYVIVGGGSAGCVLAGRLSEGGEHRVLLLESGPRYRAWRFGVPMLSHRISRRHRWDFRTAPQEACDGREVSLAGGKVIGGGSAVNSMLFVRGEPWCYDRWEAAGNPGWGHDDVLPYFTRLETSGRRGRDGHGSSGPIHVDTVRFWTEYDDRLLAGFEELGLPRVDDFGGPSQVGVGLLDVTQRRGWRSSTAAYVKQASRRPGLTVRTGAHATRIAIEDGRAVGVDFSVAGRAHHARCAGEVIVSAGAILSPTLLMRSGIGPPDHLRDNGIPVVADLPGVGEHLYDHLRLPVLYRTSSSFVPYPRRVLTPGSIRENPRGVLRWSSALARFLATGDGLVSSPGIAAVIAFLAVLPDSPGADCQFTPGFWAEDERSPHDHCVDLQPCLLDSRSRGRVRLRTPDPTAPPVVDPRYLTEPTDLRTLVGGIQVARDLARTQAFEGFLGGEVGPGPEAVGSADLARYVRRHAQSCSHPVGTCRMGPDDDAVVDHHLAVRGVDGLRVVDASVMPTIVNGNTNGPTMMIAEKAAALLRSQR